MGTAYAGFQRQPGKVTVQQVLEQAMSAVTQEKIHVVASGRTDAGAHALGQVIAFSTASSLSADVLRRAINVHLPTDVVVQAASDVAPDFHPRFDATSRVYRYLIWNGEVRSPLWEGRAARVKPRLDDQAMDRAAQSLVGHHDFGAFVASAIPGDKQRHIFRARCWREGDLVQIELEGSGFMRQMVRTISGTLIRIGSGRMGLEEFERIVESRDRTRAADTAPAFGLYLVRVNYEPVSTNDQPSIDG